MMSFYFLAISGAILIVDGIRYFISPQAAYSDLQNAMSNEAAVSVRAMFGGVQVAVGAFIFWCLTQPSQTIGALMLLAILLGVVGLTRLAFARDREISTKQRVFGLIELALAAAAAYLAYIN